MSGEFTRANQAFVDPLIPTAFLLLLVGWTKPDYDKQGLDQAGMYFLCLSAKQ